MLRLSWRNLHIAGGKQKQARALTERKNSSMNRSLFKRRQMEYCKVTGISESSEKGFGAASAAVTTNTLSYPNPLYRLNKPDLVIADYITHPCVCGQVLLGFRKRPDYEGLQACRQWSGGGSASCQGSCCHQWPAVPSPPPAHGWRGGIGDCSPGCHLCGSLNPFSSDAMLGDGFIPHLDPEEHLELPLPLRDEEEWRPTETHNRVLTCMSDCCCRHGCQPRFPPQHRSPPRGADSLQALRGVSINIPQFSIPPVGGLSLVSTVTEKMTESHPYEKRRSVRLTQQSRKVFLTYSSDLTAEMPPFESFLTKQGFRVAIDPLEHPIRSLAMDNWSDGYLRDPSVPIIVAISPKYKADIEGCRMDSSGLHTKYTHSLMQSEFIHQGSLNFRFIPCLFLGASQKHVPSWLQNTHIYHWPQDTEDLLLRLLKEERFVPPPVPRNPSIIISPMTTGAAGTQ